MAYKQYKLFCKAGKGHFKKKKKKKKSRIVIVPFWQILIAGTDDILLYA